MQLGLYSVLVVNVQIPVEQVQSYLEQLERQKTETLRQCNNNKPSALMQSVTTMNYTSYYHSPPAYSSCLMTSPTSKTTDDLSVYHAEQLGSCLRPTDGTGAAGNATGIIPLVGSSLKPEVGLSTVGDSECFTARGQHCAGAAYTPVNVHRADSSTCLHSRYIANHSRCSTCTVCVHTNMRTHSLNLTANREKNIGNFY